LRGNTERARLFGGKATIDSAPGKGTRIMVELPLVEQQPPAAEGPRDAE
jgi:signal transduction histidine kinase